MKYIGETSGNIVWFLFVCFGVLKFFFNKVYRFLLVLTSQFFPFGIGRAPFIEEFYLLLSGRKGKVKHSSQICSFSTAFTSKYS